MVRDHVFVRTTCGAVAPAPAAKRQERKTKAKRMRPPGLNDQRSLLSRGPSGLPRSGKSGKNGARSRGNRNRASDRHINNGTAALRDGRYLKQQYARRHVDVEIGDKTTPTAEYGSGQDHRR
jgi:hypothetical protein